MAKSFGALLARTLGDAGQATITTVAEKHAKTPAGRAAFRKRAKRVNAALSGCAPCQANAKVFEGLLAAQRRRKAVKG